MRHLLPKQLMALRQYSLYTTKLAEVVPIPLGSFSVLLVVVVGVVAPDLEVSGASGVEKREKVPPRWVSLSSSGVLAFVNRLSGRMYSW